MKKHVTFGVIGLNIAVIVSMAIIAFLILPKSIQEGLSIGIYLAAGASGVLIGTILSRIFYLKTKLKNEQMLLEKKQEDIQHYLTNVVHDLRSPVATINMISELLEEDLECDESQAVLITSIKNSSKLMLDRICCILDNAAAEQRKTFTVMVFENPYQVIKSAVDKLQILAIEKDIQIDLELPKKLPEVHFDKEALDSVFSNLISNAIKYSTKGTTISISRSVLPNKLEFLVKDQGLGMSKEDLSKVFGRFAKLSARPTANEDSSGIGLSIVKSLVEKMQGSVKATSEGKGKGSTFSVTLSTKANQKKLSA